MNAVQVQNYDYSGEGVVLLIDKSIDWTSFDVVKKVRALFNVRKVGHAGTLDPKATGLLIVCTGKQTKCIEQFVGLEKEYTGTMKLGVRTPSFDLETEVSESMDYSSITSQQVIETANLFLGKQSQLPPMYSAVKYGGKPLYRYARSGRTVERAEREINVVHFDIRQIYFPYVDFSITCSKGTYIRSLIDSYGLRLGCGATVTALRRVRIGGHVVSNAQTIQQLTEWRNSIVNQGQEQHETSAIH